MTEPERQLIEEAVEALRPFAAEWHDMGMPDCISDEKLILDADGVGGEIITVGDWRRLMATLTKLTATMEKNDE